MKIKYNWNTYLIISGLKIIKWKTCGESSEYKNKIVASEELKTRRGKSKKKKKINYLFEGHFG